MAKVTLTAATAIGSGYLWQFTTLTQKNNVVVARRRQHGNLIEFQGADINAVVAKINAYESYISDSGVAVSHL